MATAADPQLVDRALNALRGGDARTARDLLRRAADEGATVPWMALARACNLTGDSAGEEAALKRQLEASKRDLPALFAMAELKARQGDERPDPHGAAPSGSGTRRAAGAQARL